MVEWALSILIIIGAGLLIFSIVKIKQSSNKEKREIDSIYFSMMNEIKKLQEQNRLREIDIEILAKETTGNELFLAQRTVLRDILDLHKRGYSPESIAKNKEMKKNEVEELLTPYKPAKKEGA